MSVPETMKAMLLTGHGGPDKLVYDENFPVPEITPDEVLVKVAACGINNTDICYKMVQDLVFGIPSITINCTIV
ncbi:MAG: hypothetical protein HOH64_09765 [Rhodospirillales bacterium]|nr:hypothetical protein [Rhodospirillales bacterium]